MKNKETYIGVFISHETKIDGLNFKAIIPPGGARIYIRPQAVERMEKARWDRDQKSLSKLYKDFVITPWDTVERPSPNTNLYLQDAETELDALLGGKNA